MTAQSASMSAEVREMGLRIMFLHQIGKPFGFPGTTGT